MIEAAPYQALNLVRQICLTQKKDNTMDTIGRDKKAIAEYIKMSSQKMCGRLDSL